MYAVNTTVSCMQWIQQYHVCSEYNSIMYAVNITVSCMQRIQQYHVCSEYNSTMYAVNTTVPCMQWIQHYNVCSEYNSTMYAVNTTVSCMQWIQQYHVCSEYNRSCSALFLCVLFVLMRSRLAVISTPPYDLNWVSSICSQPYMDMILISYYLRTCNWSSTTDVFSRSHHMIHYTGANIKVIYTTNTCSGVYNV